MLPQDQQCCPLHWGPEVSHRCWLWCFCSCIMHMLSEKEKTTPFGINLTRSQVLYWAAQECCLTELPAMLTRKLALGGDKSDATGQLCRCSNSIHLFPSNASMHVSNASISVRQHNAAAEACCSGRGCATCFCHCCSYTQSVKPG